MLLWIMRDAGLSRLVSLSAFWLKPVTLEEGGKTLQYANMYTLHPCFLHNTLLTHDWFVPWKMRFIPLLAFLFVEDGCYYCNIWYSNYPYKYSDIILNPDKFLIFLIFCGCFPGAYHVISDKCFLYVRYIRVYHKHQIFWIVNKPENSTKLNL